MIFVFIHFPSLINFLLVNGIFVWPICIDYVFVIRIILSIKLTDWLFLFRWVQLFRLQFVVFFSILIFTILWLNQMYMYFTLSPIHQIISTSDEPEPEFSSSSRAELWRFRAEPSWGTLISELKPSWVFFLIYTWGLVIVSFLGPRKNCTNGNLYY